MQKYARDIVLIVYATALNSSTDKVSARRAGSMAARVNASITMGFSSKNNPVQLLIAKLFKLHTNAVTRNPSAYVMYYKDVLDILIPKLKRDYDRKTNPNSKHKDPRLSGSISKREIYKYGTQIL